MCEVCGVTLPEIGEPPCPKCGFHNHCESFTVAARFSADGVDTMFPYLFSVNKDKVGTPEQLVERAKREIHQRYGNAVIEGLVVSIHHRVIMSRQTDIIV